MARDDTLAKPKRGEEVAAALGTHCVVVDGGHWAIFERLPETARFLEEHWA